MVQLLLSFRHTASPIAAQVARPVTLPVTLPALSSTYWCGNNCTACCAVYYHVCRLPQLAASFVDSSSNPAAAGVGHRCSTQHRCSSTRGQLETLYCCSCCWGCSCVGVGAKGVGAPAVPGQAAAAVCTVQQQRTNARRSCEADHTGRHELEAPPVRDMADFTPPAALLRCQCHCAD